MAKRKATQYVPEPKPPSATYQTNQDVPSRVGGPGIHKGDDSTAPGTSQLLTINMTTQAGAYPGSDAAGWAASIRGFGTPNTVHAPQGRKAAPPMRGTTGSGKSSSAPRKPVPAAKRAAPQARKPVGGGGKQAK